MYAVLLSIFDKNNLSKRISCGGGLLVDLVADAANDVLVSAVSLVNVWRTEFDVINYFSAWFERELLGSWQIWESHPAN